MIILLMEKINRQIQNIAEDKTSGAFGIAKKGAECLLNAPSDLIEFKTICKRILLAQPTMVGLFYLVDHALALTKKGQDPRSWIQNFLRTLEESEQKIPKHAFPLFEPEDVIMTNSYSHTTLEVLKAGLAKNIRIIALESRPACEGARFAAQLGAKVCEDAAALHFLQTCSKVVVGADNITKRSFSNKIGSYALALGAKEFGIPFYVACDTTKFLPIEKSWVVQDFDRPIFEAIPIELVTSFITELGVLAPSEFLEVLRERVVQNQELLHIFSTYSKE